MHTIGSPRTLKLVLTSTGQPVLRLEGRDQRVVARIGLAVHGLEPRRIIDMGHRRDLRAHHVELVDAEQRRRPPRSSPAALMLARRRRAACRGCRRRARTSRRHPRAAPTGANGRKLSRYLTRRFSVFCIVGAARVAEDRAVAERARAEFHAALDTSRRPSPRASASTVASISASSSDRPRTRAPARGEPALDLVLRESRARDSALHRVAACWRQARLAEIEVIGGERRAERAAGVACRRLHPDRSRTRRRGRFCRWRRS